MNDADLLQSYAAHRDETAFASLIARYINLVYSSCRWQLRDAHLAEDATQAVFILLSQRAGRLRQDRLSGWLLTAARYTCANIRKTELRRTRREQVVAMLQDRNSQTDDELLRLLDDALAHLRAADREAVALRYLENQPLHDVGAALGISQEAARKRIDRAVDKLRGYFVRHGVATSSAALSALLPAHASSGALLPALQESLTHSILQTCHAGAAAAAPAWAIAKGTKTMMLINSLKSTAAAILILVLLIVGSWWALSRPTLAQSAPQAAANPAIITDAGASPDPTTAPTTTLDFSTPENTLDSYCQAMRNSDRAAVYACCTIDPHRPATAGDAFLTMNLGQNHLIRAAAKAFNSDGEEARQFPTVDVILEKLLAYNRNINQSALITGDTATLPLNLPDAILAMFPDDIQHQIRAYADHSIRFIKVNNQWKLGPGASQVTIDLQDSTGQPITDTQTQIAFVQDDAALYNNVAAQIEAGQFATWDEAHLEFRHQIRLLRQKYGVSSIHIALSPGAAQPSTQP